MKCKETLSQHADSEEEEGKEMRKKRGERTEKREPEKLWVTTDVGERKGLNEKGG